MTVIQKIALFIAIIGALNWGSIGLFGFDFVARMSGGAMTAPARVIYTVVALCGLISISMLFWKEEKRPVREYHA